MNNLWKDTRTEAERNRTSSDPIIGVGYRDNPTFDTIIEVHKSGWTWVWKTCAWTDDPEQLAKERAQELEVPYLGVVAPSMTRRRYGG